MDMKQSRFQNKRNVSGKTDGNASNQMAETMIADYKTKTGDVIHVVINGRTTIELPACLTPEEREARIENYKRLHKSRI